MFLQHEDKKNNESTTEECRMDFLDSENFIFEEEIKDFEP